PVRVVYWIQGWSCRHCPEVLTRGFLTNCSDTYRFGFVFMLLFFIIFDIIVSIFQHEFFWSILPFLLIRLFIVFDVFLLFLIRGFQLGIPLLFHFFPFLRFVFLSTHCIVTCFVKGYMVLIMIFRAFTCPMSWLVAF